MSSDPSEDDKADQIVSGAFLAFRASGRYSLALIIATRRYSLRLPLAALSKSSGGNVILSRGALCIHYRLVELF
jgi:hypothetical protein